MSDAKELINALRRIAKISYDATIEEAREASKTQRDAADLLEQQAARIADLDTKCRLYEASLDKADAERDAIRREALNDAHSAVRGCINVRDAEDAIRALYPKVGDQQ